MKNLLTLFTLFAFLALASAHAQSVTTPSSGGNQKASVTQYMGLVKITIDYSSPDVTGTGGEDRRGKIWGGLVHHGMQNLGFGPAKESPWRAGANQNTTITISHDVEVEGEKLGAGTYGLHMMTAESGSPWTIIFSHNADAWGSYYYDPAEDALRVKVTPVKNAYHEWLTYGFDNRQQAECTAFLAWEELKVPFKIAASNMHDYYVANFDKELQTRFGWQDYQAAATYCLQNNTHLEKGLSWSEVAVAGPFIGQKNFATLSTKSGLLQKLGKTDEAKSAMDEAIKAPGTGVGQIHQYGRQLISSGEAEKALEIFKYNAEKFPDTWPVNVGLARGYSAVGDYKMALKHAKMAQNNIPEADKVNKDSVASMIEKLGKKEDIN